MEKTLWHPVALAEAVVHAPLAVQLLQQDLVLWRDQAGQVHAFVDRCPHRGARLSLGRVEADRLECPYHGWQFAADGHCEHVPAVPDFVPPPAHCVRSFAVQELYGLVWVQLEAADVAAPQFPAEGDDRLRKLNCGPYDVAASAPRIIENFLDMSHFGFVHEGWLGSRDATAMERYDVEDTPTGVRATNCKARQPQSNLHSTAAADVHYTYEVTDPYTALLYKLPEAGTSREGWHESIGLFICPLTPETSRVWFRLAVADFDTPDAQLQAFQHTIFTQDQPVLESQQPKCLPLDPRAELHSAADRLSSAYRRYLKARGISFGVCR
ncbi:aromatic ring-hydroxylating oxygenase subunit alpha [Comamonas endophytica]|uniref:Aromatic ring-hydroxylating dioxygenase subunit alpha n=1 Tax=Comamonas endophytica TaxID=2949090 RepID=A0ABY6G835_9BURK|nr:MULTISPECIES: aromatic ring-hydroxylating dioxygenase subunit alpha [unclassified Acidovorax]MCD2511524.1 aromatic ring-hydroxylating dioxygenase subunit alpha [Acidovorax sp. D4N7]UYG50910.1 aromatic ring-hydroxylating dioxygenase subunit alpha [Acidovorax sp. 5MLIR]